MSEDDRPSISELQRLELASLDKANPYTPYVIRDSVLVLLEIAAAALEWQMSPQTKAREARRRLLAALSKVRP